MDNAPVIFSDITRAAGLDKFHYKSGTLDKSTILETPGSGVALLDYDIDYERSNTDSFRYEKNIDGNVVQLDLLADLPRTREDDSIIKVYGAKTSRDLCLIDDAEDLNEHVETIQINCREGELVETFEIAVPNAADFLILKTTVCRYREKPKDAYDIY